VYCADAFVNEGFPALQDDAQFMTYLSEQKIQAFIDQGFFPNGNEVYWHDGIQLWVIDESSDFLGDATSPQYLDPPIFAPPALDGRFVVTPPPNTPLDRAPPPLFSFTEELEIQDERFLQVTHLGTALFSGIGAEPTNSGFFVNMDPRPGPSLGAGPTNYNYQTYYRPAFAMANNLPKVKSKGLPIDMAQIIYRESDQISQVLECPGERDSGECEAQVVLDNPGGDIFSMQYGPSTVEGVYGTNSIYIHPRHSLSLFMVSTELVSLEEQCDGTVNSLGPPYFFTFGQSEVPNDQGVLTGLIYQDGGTFLPCNDPIFPPVDPCDPSTVFLQSGTTGFGSKGLLRSVNPAGGTLEITAGLCSMFSQFPSADSYVKTRGGRELPNPIDGLGIFFKGAGRSELASDFRVPELGIDEGEENFIESGNGLTIFQPVSIQ
jgi:hypothetical protein